MSKDSRVDVLQIGGVGRSGSTLLARLLGVADGVFFAGEIRHIWRDGFANNTLCGCGQKFADCEFWQSVVREAFGSDFSGSEVEALRLSVDSARFAPLLLSPWRPRAYQDNLERLVGLLDRLYRAIGKLSGCDLIVDSSKNPAYGLILSRLRTINLSMVHLVRDSRAVAFSYRRRRRRPEFGDQPKYMETRSPLTTSGVWNVYNLLTSLRARSVPTKLVRYEDLVDQPREIVGQILSGALKRDFVPTYINGGEARLSSEHTVAGNPMRFSEGALPLRLDEEWKTRMNRAQRALVTALTLLMLAYYGYLVRSG